MEGIRMRRYLVLATLLLVSGSPAVGAGIGQGGCSIKDGAPMYYRAKGDKLIGTLNRLDCVAGVTTRGILGNEYLFEKENGRVHVAALNYKGEPGRYFTAWMDPADLSTFTFECGCGSTDQDRASCTPLSGANMTIYSWNPCFIKASELKATELKAGGAQAVSGASGNEKALRNEDVLTLIKVGLDDALISSKIQQSKVVAFDLSTDGIVALKKAGASNAVIDAMMKRAEKQ
jgi:hypothetical protein